MLEHKTNSIPKIVLFGVVLLFLFGLVLRLYRIDEGLIFGYDQARDAYRSRSIIRNGDLKLLGPETDIPGVNHGVGYYYLIALPLALSDDPVVTTSMLAVFNALGIFIVFYAAWFFFRNWRLALIASALYTVSFEIVQYARWLSNPSLGVLTVLLVFVALWAWIKGFKNGLTFSLVMIALCLHFQFFLIYLYAMPIIIFFIYHPRSSKRSLFGGILMAFIIDLPLILAEFKFHFQAINAFRVFLSSQSGTYDSVSNFLIRYLDRFVSVVFHTIVPFNSTVAFLVAILAVVLIYQHRHESSKNSPHMFLLLWLFSSFPMFIFSSGALNSEFSFVGVSVSLIFLTAYALDALWRNKQTRFLGIFIFASLMFLNMRFDLVHAQDGSFIFSVQRVMTYGYEKKIMDYTYHEAKGQPFSICTLTNPLFINTTWAYLYETYGKKKYEYLPSWSGSDQTGLLGNLPINTLKPPLKFLIFEPLLGMPPHASELFTKIENYISDKVDEKSFGEFRVEKRRLLTEKEREDRRNGYTEAYNKEVLSQAYLLYRCFN